jgi:ABC-2 type transport system permease protein
MTDQSPVKRFPPSSFGQMITVTRYELLKHMRSKRLVGSIAVIALIVTLIYIIPPALSNPYAGHMTQTLEFRPQGFMGYAFLNNSNPTNSSIVIHVNGTLLPHTNWTYESSMNAVMFYQNLSGKQIVADFDFKQTSQDFAERFMQFANTLVVILVTFFGADAIVSEYQNRTAYLLFPNPVSREIMFAGKFIASFIASLTMVGLFYILTMSLSFATLGDVAKYLPLSFCFAALFLVACLAVAFFVSSILKGSTGAIILTFFMFLMILPIVQSVGMLSGAKMWFLISFMGDLPTTTLSWDNYPVDSSSTQFGFTFYNFYPDPGTSIAVMLAYLLIFSVLTIFLFRRKQLLG